MKVSSYAAIALLAQSSSAFTAPRPALQDRLTKKLLPASHDSHPSMTPTRPVMRGSSQLFFNGNGNNGGIGEYLGQNPVPGDGLAFADIVNDDMESLEKRLAEGLDPDTRFFYGNTILHLIALKSNDKSLNEDKYRAVLAQIVRSGGNLHAKNDMGCTALDFLRHKKFDEFSDNIKQAQIAKVKAPLKKDLLDNQLATFSLQKNQSTKGKNWIIELVKSGANPEYVTSNGKTVVDNINTNWPKASAKAFTALVIAAKLQSAANGQDKALDKTHINDQWTNAVMDFYKAKPH